MIKHFSQSRFFGSLSDNSASTTFTIRFICPYTAFTASHRHDHLVTLKDFSVSLRPSPFTSVLTNRAWRMRLASKKLYRAWIVPQSVTQWFNLCHSILKGEAERMSVIVDEDTEREVFFHSCSESLVYHISGTIECFANNAFEVQIEFSDSRFHQFIQYLAFD